MSKNAPILPLEITEKSIVVLPDKKIINASYAYCHAITKNHYENFPVASMILPRSLRPAVEAIYAFSRLADDFADEKEYHGVRLEKLQEWQNYLDDTSLPTHPVFIALHYTIKNHELPHQLFSDLLTAFRMDVHKKQYLNFNEVLYYCEHSANPVGRLVLHLFKFSNEECLQLSDHICTALQLTNFWQDIAIDLKKDRIYLPIEDMDRYFVTKENLLAHKCDENFKRLMFFQLERTQEIFLRGKKLGLVIPGKLGLELRLTWLTGMTILKKIKAARCDIFKHRPQLTKKDFVQMFFVALNKKSYEKFSI